MSDPLKEFVARVEAFEIDSDHKTLRFVDRLARENRWTVAYAGRVIREYLRFCILAMRSGHPVTPSEDVDQAWHLHLTYTRSYWERFCGETLDGPLHHEPTAGGPDEGEKFRDWYQATLDSYRQLFGCDPPQDIWPPTTQRFAHAGEFKWMNTGREWAIPKRLVAVCAGAIACGIAAAALTSLGMADMLRVGIAATPVTGVILPVDLSASAFLAFYAVLSVFGLVVVLGLRIAASASEDYDARVDDAGELSTDQLAVLSGGGSRLAHVALTRLFAERRIEATKTLWWYSKFKVIAPPPEQPAIDRDLYAAIKSGTPMSQLMEVVKPHFERIEATLVEKGLRHPNGRKSSAATCVVVFIGTIGGIRLVQGLVRGEEIGYLLVMTVLFIIAAIAMNSRRSRTTSKGTAFLENAKAIIGPSAITKANPEPAVLAMSVAVLGTSAVAGFGDFAPLASLAPSVGRASSAAGCGAGCSGCGGGGCGGGGCGGGGCGGGGCGGCGG